MGRKPYWMTTLLVAGLVAGACEKKADESATTADTTAMAPAPAAPAPAAAAAPTDPQIAHIAVTANDIDIDHGKMAKEKSKNADVKKFAETMIKDHTGVNDQASALVKKLNVTPEDNPTSQKMKSDADAAKNDLSSKSGADFDKAYIANEVTFHQQVLDALDQTLIPNAQNAELKALLQQVRPAVAAHLQMAKDLQTKLGA